MRQSFNMNIIDQDLSYDFKAVQISLCKAQVKVTEWYKFYFNDKCNEII